MEHTGVQDLGALLADLAALMVGLWGEPCRTFFKGKIKEEAERLTGACRGFDRRGERRRGCKRRRARKTPALGRFEIGRRTAHSRLALFDEYLGASRGPKYDLSEIGFEI